MKFNCQLCGKSADTEKYSTAKVASGELCFHCAYWQERADNIGSSRSVRINGTQYQLGADRDDDRWKGCAGQRFVIEFFDGRRITTNDLWVNGKIPARFDIPDNARFIEE